MKLKFWFFILSCLLLILSCGEPPDYENFKKHSQYNSKLSETVEDSTITTPSYNNSKSSTDYTPMQNNTIIAKDTISVPERLSTTVAEVDDGNSRFSVPKTYFQVYRDKISMVLDDNNLLWQYNRNLDPDKWLVVNNPDSTRIINDGVTLHVSNRKINAIKVDKVTYLFTDKKIEAETPNLTTRKLSYLDNYTVVVKSGQNLNWIIQQYNLENNTNYSLADVLNKNPYIKRRKNFTVYTGDEINF